MSAYFRSLLRQTGFQVNAPSRPRATPEQPLTLDRQVTAPPAPVQAESASPLETRSPTSEPVTATPPKPEPIRQAIERQQITETAPVTRQKATPTEELSLERAITKQATPPDEPGLAARPPRPVRSEPRSELQKPRDIEEIAIIEEKINLTPPSARQSPRSEEVSSGGRLPDATTPTTPAFREISLEIENPIPPAPVTISPKPAQPAAERGPARSAAPPRALDPPKSNQSQDDLTAPALVKIVREWVGQTPAPGEKPPPILETAIEEDAARPISATPVSAKRARSQSNAQASLRVEQEQTLSIGAINITVEGPTPNTQMQQQPAKPHPAAPRRDPLLNRLDRHYLRF